MKNSNNRCIKIRKKILELSKECASLTLGGSFSSVRINRKSFFGYMKKKDKFILSKGHVGILLYVVLFLKEKFQTSN